MVETKEKRQQASNSGSQALLVNNNGGNSKNLSLNSIKNLKLEFPRFHGEETNCGVYRANQFFFYHNTPEHQKVTIAYFHLDEEALIWFQNVEQVGGFTSWEVFIKALQTRFGDTTYDDPMEAFT